MRRGCGDLESFLHHREYRAMNDNRGWSFKRAQYGAIPVEFAYYLIHRDIIQPCRIFILENISNFPFWIIIEVNFSLVSCFNEFCILDINDWQKFSIVFVI